MQKSIPAPVSVTPVNDNDHLRQLFRTKP